MKAKTIVTGLFLLANTTLFAQSDAQSSAILKSVSAKYKSYTAIKADFSVLTEDPKAKTKDTQNGTVSLKGGKYKLEIKGQEVTCDGKTVWTFVKDANEVQISEPNTSEDALTPSNIFTMYEKGFEYKFIEEKTEGTKQIQVIDIKPLDAKKNFFKIRLTIDKADKNIVRSEVFNKNGSHITYSIRNFTGSAQLTDAMFSFDKSKHPGVEVVDLR